MRSGFQKPGTVPFLALIIFSLLSLVPTLAKEWDFYSAHLVYLGLPRYDGRYSSPRVKNASIDSRSRLQVNENDCKSWLFGDFYSTCSDSNTQPYHSILHTPPRSAFEAGAEPPNDAITFSAAKEPLSITRGVSAFKEFVIKRWDDQQTTQSVPLQHDLIDDISIQPTLTSVPVIPASSIVQECQSTQNNERHGTSSTDEPAEDSILFRWPLFIHEAWQQVCHTGGYYLESLTTRPSTYNHTLTTPESSVSVLTGEQIHSTHLQPEKQQADVPTRGPLAISSGLTQSHASPGLEDSQQAPVSLPDSPATTAGQSKYTGFRRDSESMRGSSMAIVIALVAGIMWF